MKKILGSITFAVGFLLILYGLSWVFYALRSTPEEIARRQVAQLEEKWKSQKYFDLTDDPCAALKRRDLFEIDFHPFTHSELIDRATKERIGGDDAYYAHQYSNAVIKAKKVGLKVECNDKPEYELIGEAWGPMIHHYSNENIAFVRYEYIKALRAEIDQLITEAENIGITREELGR